MRDARLRDHHVQRSETAHPLRHQVVDARHVCDVAVSFTVEALDFQTDGSRVVGVGFDVVDADVEAVVC